MIFCKIENSMVVNRIVVPDGTTSWGDDGEVWIASDVAQIGWPYENGQFIAPAVLPDRPLTEADYSSAVQAHIEMTARARGYHDAVTCASYVVSTVPMWQSEGQIFAAWRDAVWTYVYEQLSAVRSQQREKPTIDALVAELPAIKWER